VYTVEPDSPYAVRSRLARGPTADGQVDSLGKEYAWSARPRYVQVRRVHRASRAGESGLGRPPTDRCLRVRGVCTADGVGSPTRLCVRAESTTHARQGRISDRSRGGNGRSCFSTRAERSSSRRSPCMGFPESPSELAIPSTAVATHAVRRARALRARARRPSCAAPLVVGVSVLPVSLYFSKPLSPSGFTGDKGAPGDWKPTA